MDGVIVSLHPHAFVVVDAEGHGVLTHLGIDTVQLNGEGFELLVNKGDTVTRGQAVVRWNPAAVEVAGKSPICPIVALEATADSLGDLRERTRRCEGRRRPLSAGSDINSAAVIDGRFENHRGGRTRRTTGDG